ncbi:shikimate kinase [Paenibacillus aurantius]|uniref:Shikimate kinase n=1 Tax=Paenibacillus aurantius TaxID=2918900 RepID=A0AA96RHQ0_9BACL|nr:shikimate kinase [Paenibacillus aurantius]WNQ13618.1 shikimate kinase [Paenibacillus aurantius]
MNKNNIILIGFMGTGKTTLGRRVAERLGWAFVDMDERIEEKEERGIPSIFESQGEDYFRRVETAVLAELAEGTNQVISTGGGCVLREENRRLMAAAGTIVALKASPRTIVDRVRGDANRPLLQGDLEQRVAGLLEQRKEAYDFADLTLMTDERSLEEMVEELAALAAGK